jgi:large subunit ribosomal protein L29
VKASELRDRSDEELRELLEERRQAVFNFRLQDATGAVENVRGSRNARRDVARILTILRERELTAGKEAK